MLTRKQFELLRFIHERLTEAGVPPSFDEMKEALRLKSKSGIHRLITGLEERGFQLQETAGGWRLYTHPAYHDQVEQLVLSWDTRALSQAALEALAVIAYHQPTPEASS